MAGKTAGALGVSLELDTSSFEKGVTDAERSLAQLNATVAKVGNAIGVGIGTGINLAVKGLVAFETASVAALKGMDSLIKGVSDFQDVADKTGASAEGLASFAAAASLSGTSIEQIGKASVLLSKNLANVNSATSDAAKAIKYLGLNFDDFKKLSPDDQIDAVSKALANIPDSANKSAVAIALFGRAGAELLPFLKDLNEEGGRQVVLTAAQIQAADDYQKSQARLVNSVHQAAQVFAADYAPALQDLESAFADALKQTLGYDEATKRFTGNNTLEAWFSAASGAIETFGNILIIAKKGIEVVSVALFTLADTLQRVLSFDFSGAVRVFKLGIEQIGDIANREDKSITQRIADNQAKRIAAQQVAAASALQGDGGEAIANGLRGNFTTGTARKTTGANSGESAAKSAIKSMQDQLDKIHELTASQNLLQDIEQHRYDGASAASIARLKQLAAELDAQKAIGRQLELDASYQAAFDAASEQADKDKLDRYTRLQNLTGEAQRKQAEAGIFEVNQALQKNLDGGAGGINTDQANIALQKLYGTLDGLQQKTTDVEKEANSFAVQAAANIQDVLGDGLYDALQGNFKNIGASFKQMLDKLVAQSLAADLAKKLFGGDFGKTGEISSGSGIGQLLSYFGGSAGTTTPTGAIGFDQTNPVPSNAIGGGASSAGFFSQIAGLFGYANGGVPPYGRFSLVGERGPELIAGNGLARVHPLSNLGGGGGTTVNQYITTKDADSFRKSQQQNAQDARRSFNNTARSI